MHSSFPPPIEKILGLPVSAQLVAAASFLSLAFAFTMQYGFGVEPCILCLWQRVPYALALLFAFAAFLLKPHGRRNGVLMALAALCFGVGFCLAVFHTGVERHWWLGTEGCSIRPLHGGSVEDMRTMLLATPAAQCDQISWTFLGFSMANWNVALSFALETFATLAAIRLLRK